MSHSSGRTAGFRAALIGLTLLAAVVRFHGVWADSYWLDELATLRRASSDWPTLMRDAHEKEAHPPLYYILSWSLYHLTGEGERTLRLASAALGTLTVPVLGAAAELLLGPEAGVGSAALLAVNRFHVYYSREARSYALLTLVASLSFCHLLAFLLGGGGGQPGRRWRDWTVFVVSSVVMLYTHYFGSVLLAVEGLTVLALARRTGVRSAVQALAGLGLCAVLYLPWLGEQLRDMSMPRFWTRPPTLGSWPELMTQWWGPSPVALAGCALLLALGVASLVRKRQLPLLAGVLAWMIGPPVMAYVKSMSGAAVWLPRTLIVALPGWLVLMGAGLGGLGSRSRRWLVTAVLIVAGLANLRAAEPELGQRGQVDVRGASAWILRMNRTVHFPIYSNLHAEYLGWYFRQAGSPDWTEQQLPSDTDSTLPPVFWLLEGHSFIERDQQRQVLLHHRKLISERFDLAHVQLYVPRAPDPRFDAWTELSLLLAPSLSRQPQAESLDQLLASRGSDEALLMIGIAPYSAQLSGSEQQALAAAMSACSVQTAPDTVQAAVAADSRSDSLAMALPPPGTAKALLARGTTAHLSVDWPPFRAELDGGVLQVVHRPALQLPDLVLPAVCPGLTAVRVELPSGRLRQVWSLCAERTGGTERASFAAEAGH